MTSGANLIIIICVLSLGWVSLASELRGNLVTVDWDVDATADGQATGVLLSVVSVTMNSTNGGLNGGIVGNSLWATWLGTNDVPGIGDAGVVNDGAAFDWNSGQQGSVMISFGGAVLTNPILLFHSADNFVETFDFDDGIALSLVDQNPAGSVTIASGNVVTTNGAHNNGGDDGFALQLTGAFSSISFNSNTTLASSVDSLGITVAVQNSNVAIPEARSVLCLGLLVAAIVSGSILRRRTTVQVLLLTS